MTTYSVDPVVATVLVTNSQVAEFPSNVMCGTTVLVPVCINAIGSNMSLLITNVIVIILEPPPATAGRVSFFVANLTHHVDPGGGAAPSTTTATAPSRWSASSSTSFTEIVTILLQLG
jgi:hypothetical protein